MLLATGSPQYKFMEADLKAVNRTKTPWLILNGHRPIYTTNTGGASPYVRLFTASVHSYPAIIFDPSKWTEREHQSKNKFMIDIETFGWSLVASSQSW